ncbi:MAG: hypothetical protein M3T56_02090 [Chloroflexota bacterium]|nr:hypothetical protein [Chloroflexota bacterium]
MRTKDSDPGITSLDDARTWRMIKAAQDAPPRPLIPYGFSMDAETRKLVDEMIESVTATALNQDKDAAAALELGVAAEDLNHRGVALLRRQTSERLDGALRELVDLPSGEHREESVTTHDTRGPGRSDLGRAGRVRLVQSHREDLVESAGVAVQDPATEAAPPISFGPKFVEAFNPRLNVGPVGGPEVPFRHESVTSLSEDPVERPAPLLIVWIVHQPGEYGRKRDGRPSFPQAAVADIKAMLRRLLAIPFLAV